MSGRWGPLAAALGSIPASAPRPPARPRPAPLTQPPAWLASTRSAMTRLVPPVAARALSLLIQLGFLISVLGAFPAQMWPFRATLARLLLGREVEELGVLRAISLVALAGSWLLAGMAGSIWVPMQLVGATAGKRALVGKLGGGRHGRCMTDLSGGKVSCARDAGLGRRLRGPCTGFPSRKRLALSPHHSLERLLAVAVPKAHGSPPPLPRHHRVLHRARQHRAVEPGFHLGKLPLPQVLDDRSLDAHRAGPDPGRGRDPGRPLAQPLPRSRAPLMNRSHRALKLSTPHEPFPAGRRRRRTETTHIDCSPGGCRACRSENRAGCLEECRRDARSSFRPISKSPTNLIFL